MQQLLECDTRYREEGIDGFYIDYHREKEFPEDKTNYKASITIRDERHVDQEYLVFLERRKGLLHVSLTKDLWCTTHKRIGCVWDKSSSIRSYYNSCLEYDNNLIIKDSLLSFIGNESHYDDIFKHNFSLFLNKLIIKLQDKHWIVIGLEHYAKHS